MKISAFLLGVLLCLSSLTEGRASSHSTTSESKVVGNFTILAFAKEHSFILTNNKTYKPTKHHYVKLSNDWQLGDPIRVLTANHHDKFILINTRTGQTIKTRRLNLAD